MLLLPLGLGACLLIFVSRSAIGGIARIYQRFLESIILRALSEQALTWVPEEAKFACDYPVFDRYCESRINAKQAYKCQADGADCAKLIGSADRSSKASIWNKLG